MQSSTRCLKIIILFCNVSEIFVRSINFVVFVLFKASVVKVSVWRRFYCSQKMFVDFVETAFICLSSLVTVRDMHCFFLNLQIRRPQHHCCIQSKSLRNFDSPRKFSSKISRSCESFGVGCIFTISEPCRWFCWNESNPKNGKDKGNPNETVGWC